jgi:predicted peroxiredoxin
MKAQFSWKHLIIIFTLLLSNISLWNTPSFGAISKEQQNVIVHLSRGTEDLHRVSMALKLATALQSAGANVTLFLDLEGVRIADQNLPQDLAWGFGPQKASVQELLQNYVTAGGQVLICPHCAEAAGISPAALKSEAIIASNDNEVAVLFLQADKVIDY